MPARASRKLVIDLSTQRSIARASFQTRTPISRSACRMPSRSVTASKVPPDMERTNTASGRRSRSPAMSKPGRALRVEAAQRAADRRTSARPARRAPCRARARASRMPVDDERRCGARLMRARPRACYANEASSRSRSTRPVRKLSPRVERRDDDLRRAEQHRIDGVEVALDALEDLGERPAVVARAFARQLLGQAHALRRPGRSRTVEPVRHR